MKITRTDLRGMIKEALQEMRMYGGPEGRRTLSPRLRAAPRRMGMGEHLEIDWKDFAPYSMDQIGAAFVAAGGDPMDALQMLQMEQMEAEEDVEEDEDYVYGDDPEEFLDLPAGEIQRRMRGED